MPKSKRSREYTLSQTRKKGVETKKQLLQEVRDCVDRYSNIYMYAVENMRNSNLKDVRSQWKCSRFFFGKNRVMQCALGLTAAEEYKDGLHLLAKSLQGSVGLLFTNKSTDEVEKWFSLFSQEDYARAGFVAPRDVCIRRGILDNCSHNMEPQLRKLGLPVVLEKGKILLTEDYTVCKEKDTLTPEQCTILKLMNQRTADFRVVLKAKWCGEGLFQLIQD